MAAEDRNALFTVETGGRDALGLCAVCERYVNGLWMADHFMPAELAASALDQFKRAVVSELEQLDVQFDGQ